MRHKKSKYNNCNSSEKIELNKDYVIAQAEKFRQKYNQSLLQGQKLSRKSIATYGQGIIYDNKDFWSLDRYYIDFINNTLRDLRHNEMAWVFNIEQLEEVFRFEPHINVEYSADSGVIYLWKQ